MKFVTSIIAVEDIARARKLYEGILGQKVTADFGEYNVSFAGGLAFYQEALYRSLIAGDREVLHRSNSFELYFEEDDLERFEAMLLRNDFEFIHPIREEPWKQRAFRFYDQDRNIVVLAESMGQVYARLQAEGLSVEEMSKLTGEAVGVVEEMLKKRPATEKK